VKRALVKIVTTNVKLVLIMKNVLYVLTTERMHQNVHAQKDFMMTKKLNHA
jgi:hypothetical protein